MDERAQWYSSRIDYIVSQNVVALRYTLVEIAIRKSWSIAHFSDA